MHRSFSHGQSPMSKNYSDQFSLSDLFGALLKYSGFSHRTIVRLETSSYFASNLVQCLNSIRGL